MGRRGEKWKAIVPDTSGLPARRLTDKREAELLAAARVERTESAQAWGEMVARVAAVLGKIAAAG